VPGLTEATHVPVAGLADCADEALHRSFGLALAPMLVHHESRLGAQRFDWTCGSPDLNAAFQMSLHRSKLRDGVQPLFTSPILDVSVARRMSPWAAPLAFAVLHLPMKGTTIAGPPR